MAGRGAPQGDAGGRDATSGVPGSGSPWSSTSRPSVYGTGFSTRALRTLRRPSSSGDKKRSGR